MTESVSAFSLGTSDTQEKMENSDLLSEDIAYWLEPDDHFIQPGNILLSRARRDASNTTGDLSIWEKIEINQKVVLTKHNSAHKQNSAHKTELCS
nr:hypothetical protein BgiMline_015679 [Biomphalaria glabrata]